MILKDKVILITGGAVRLGKAISLELSRGGASIFCQYHTSAEAARELKEQIEGENGIIHIFPSDLTTLRGIQQTVTEVIQVYNRVDVLINNAALFYKTPFGTVTGEDWDTFHSLNSKAAFFLAQEVSSYMLKQHAGKIINIGDAASVSPFPAYLPYSISKAGIIAMTKGLAKALAPHIQVNCINPGPVMIPDYYSEEERQHSINQTLLKREGSAEDIAKTVRFLIEGSDYITGAVIAVDGGRQIR